LFFAFVVDVFKLLLSDVAVIAEELHEERSVIVLELALERVCAAVAHCESLEVHLHCVLIVGGMESTSINFYS
jgi:hypothetical protein